MINRRRKSDGFEWHHHVRTTILVRRENRIEQANAAKRAARRTAGEIVRQTMRVSRRAVVRFATSVRAGAVFGLQVMAGFGGRARDASLKHGARFGRGLRSAAAGASAQMAEAGVKAGDAARVNAHAFANLIRELPTPSREDVRDRLRNVAKKGSPIRRFGAGLADRVGRIDWRGMMPSRLPRFRVPATPALSGVRRAVSGPVRKFAPGVALAGGAGLLLFGGYSAISAISLPQVTLAGLTGGLMGPSTETLSGRARAIDGETIILSGERLRLAGVAAPLANQICRTRRGRPWRCGRSASRLLARFVRGETTTCEANVSASADGRRLASCKTGRRDDLSRHLVERGAVFTTDDASSDLIAAAAEAKSDRKGIWRGRADRPEEYRDALWAKASRAAPDGCPIKGRNLARKRVYVVPWSPSYRRTRVRTTRGDRWFCTEEQAIAAGWQPADAG
ncbi:MAG: thermonuclease family protein [Pseudomonadota bacterium]